MTKFAIALLVGVAAAPVAAAQTAPAPAPAPTTAPAPASGPAVGATVKDTAGGVVGTIASVEGDLALIDTGTNKVRYPLTSITNAPTGPIVAVTKAELDARYAETQAKAQAELQAKLVAGTMVHARDGTTMLGTIKETGPDTVTVTTTAKRDVQLPRNAFGPAPHGVVIGMTAAEFAAAIGG